MLVAAVTNIDSVKSNLPSLRGNIEEIYNDIMYIIYLFPIQYSLVWLQSSWYITCFDIDNTIKRRIMGGWRGGGAQWAAILCLLYNTMDWEIEFYTNLTPALQPF